MLRKICLFFVTPFMFAGLKAAAQTIIPDGSTITGFYSTSAPGGFIRSLKGNVIGSDGAWDNVSTKEKVFDGDDSTYFDALQGNGQWVGLDLGATKIINYIKFHPRLGYESRMRGGFFQVSSDASFTNATTIYQIPADLSLTKDYYITGFDTNGVAARYVRYVSPNNGWGNVAEISILSSAVTSFYSTSAPLANSVLSLTGNVIGSNGAWDNASTKEKVFDGDNSTYFDAPQGNGQWVGLDLGASKVINYIKFHPRQGYEFRMSGGLFQVSSDANFTNAITVYQIPDTMSSTGDYYITSSNPGGVAARYVRYLSPDDGWGNVAEISVLSSTTASFHSTSAPLASSVSPLTGNVIGSNGAWDNVSTKEKAFDGDNSTYFDAPQGNGQWVGLDLGTSQMINYIKFRPRQGYEFRMSGGLFQVSNDANFTNAITVYQIPDTLGSTKDYYITSSNPRGVAARYVRYISPNDGWGNVAEISILSSRSGLNYAKQVNLVDNKLSMNLSPNPVDNRLQLQIDGAAGSSAILQVVNLAGQTMINKTVALHDGSNTLTLERGTLPGGVYIVRLQQEGATIQQKAVFN